MDQHTREDIPHTQTAMLLLGICLALYCVIGFTDHDPSIHDEAYIFGIVLEYLRGKSWVVPTLAGWPFMEKPPLYYLIGAFFGRVFSPWLALHDAVRLSTAGLMLVTLIATAASARLLWGKGYGRFAALALLSCIALAIPSHKILTDNAQLTGIAIALLGIAAVVQRKSWAGFAIGTGVGIAFLSKGLLGPGIIGFCALLLLVFPAWRCREYVLALIVAFVTALPWLCIWPLALYHTSPTLFHEWLVTNNFGRFLGHAPSYLNAVKDQRFWYLTLWLATFPLLPIAAVTLFRYRSKWQSQPAIQVGLALTVAVLLVLAMSSTLRPVYAMPVLPALALIAAPVFREPTRGLNQFAVHTGRYFFAVAAVVIWILWLGAVYGVISPNRFGLNGVFPTDLKITAQGWHVLGALLLTVFWCICQWAWRQQKWRGGAIWYLSFNGALALIALLWVPSVNGRNEYRPLFEQMATKLPTSGCVSSIGLGDSQRGMLYYVAQVDTVPVKNPSKAQCDALLVEGLAHKNLPGLSAHWVMVWKGKLPEERKDHIWLYVRTAI